MIQKLGVFLILVISANAFTWSQVVSWKNKTIKPDAKYSIETEGYNVRVYEFTPVTDPGSTCIMTFTNEKMGMYCFNKSDKALKNPNK
ncbi:MAG: hypothetical protein OIF32_06345 [Campylobacterales bacterium]|nr:hypothetical protein [Campylobacterales bacterium]